MSAWKSRAFASRRTSLNFVTISAGSIRKLAPSFSSSSRRPTAESPGLNTAELYLALAAPSLRYSSSWSSAPMIWTMTASLPDSLANAVRERVATVVAKRVICCMADERVSRTWVCAAPATRLSR